MQMAEAGWMSGNHAPPQLKQARWMSGNHTSPPQQLEQLEDQSSASQTSALPVTSELREPQPGLGRDIKATTSTANQSQHRPNRNANLDDDIGGKMYPPGAGQSIQSINSSSCNSRNSPQTLPAAPHRISGGKQLQFVGEKRAHQHSDSSDSGPPPKRTHHPEGGGHAVKRVGTDTLHPPTSKRRVAGNEVHEVT
jgi:hypothetical protein